MTTPPDIPRAELVRRVLYSLLSPPARVARAFRVPLGELSEWSELAYFHELRGAGFKMREIADQLDVSMRKAANLSARLKQNFLDPERAVGLPRRIEFMLWAGPLSNARLYQVLPNEEPDAIDEALAALVSEGRVVLSEDGGRPVYTVTGTEYRLYSEDWLNRIDGLNHLLDAIGQVAFARFFAPESPSFARTVSLRVREEDLPALHALYQDTMWPALLALDEAAADDEEARAIDLAFCWSPQGAYDANDEGEES